MRFNFKLKYLGIILILISGYFYLCYFSSQTNGNTFCIFKNVTGIPCPACGSTRATLLLFHGKILESVLVNPFGLITNILIIGSIVWMIVDLIKGKETYFSFMKKDWNRKVKIIVLLIIVINWIWNIKKGI